MADDEKLLKRATRIATMEASRLRDRQVLDQRLQGRTLPEIAADIGVTPAAILLRLRKVLSLSEERRDELRQLENARLDTALNAIWPRVLAGNDNAIRSLLTIMERRASLLGLDAPTRIDLRIGEERVAETVRAEALSRGLPNDAAERAVAEAISYLRETAKG